MRKLGARRSWATPRYTMKNHGGNGGATAGGAAAYDRSGARIRTEAVKNWETDAVRDRPIYFFEKPAAYAVTTFSD